MAGRMHCFLTGIYRQAELFKLPLEVVIVEWNPVSDLPGLAETLPKPSGGGFAKLRIITVPEEINAQYKSSAFMGVQQMTGKNVGIRRAKGQFVLCTNVDILFSDALMERIAQKDLSEGAYYRANRCDVPAEVTQIETEVARLEFCQQNVFKVFGLDPNRPKLMEPFLTRNRNKRVKTWVLNQLIGIASMLFKEINSAVDKLDLWACGDFTMMSKAAWMKIDGYAELDTYPAHVDSLGVASASAAGYKTSIFKPNQCAYHIDHGSGYETGTPEEIVSRMVNRQGPDYGMVYIAISRMLERKAPLKYNKPDWGWANETFVEKSFF